MNKTVPNWVLSKDRHTPKFKKKEKGEGEEGEEEG